MNEKEFELIIEEYRALMQDVKDLFAVGELSKHSVEEMTQDIDMLHKDISLMRKDIAQMKDAQMQMLQILKRQEKLMLQLDDSSAKLMH